MTTLQDICLLITDGKHGDCTNEEGSGYYFISCKDVKDGWIDYSGARQITETDFLDTHRRTQLEPNDILMTNSGTIGRMAFVPEASETGRTTFQKSVAIIKPNPIKVVPKWLHYYLIAQKEDLIVRAGGTAQKNLLLRDLRSFEVQVPAFLTQREIATILSAYDDLIENNARRIQILEEMARAIYREWFVNFRFPSHGDVKMVNSELGKIPKGWEIKELGDLCKLVKEKFRKEDHFNLALLDLARIPQRTLLIDDMGSPSELSTSRIIFQEDDILFGSIRPYLHKVALASCRGVTNTSVLVIRTEEEINRPLLAVLLSSIDSVRWADQYSTGTKMPVIKWDIFKTMPVLVPDKQTLNKFNSITTPILQIIKSTFFRNRNLRQTRDLLLPRLISGDLDVSELDIVTEELKP